MDSRLINLIEEEPSLKNFNHEFENAITLKSLVLAGFRLGIAIAVLLVEHILMQRAELLAKTGPDYFCHDCGELLTSKGFLSRMMKTILGDIHWKRQIRRCPNGCKGSHAAPFDDELGITPYQKYSSELKQMACILAVFVPYNIASSLLKTITGIEICPKTIWNWVQWAGRQVMEKLQVELENLNNGHNPEEENIDPEIALLPMLIGGDGVMVPFRPESGTAEGKTVWKEVKVGIISRIMNKTTKKGKEISVTVRRRLTAVLGDISELQSRLWLTSLKEGILNAETIVWLSDGGSGFWGLFSNIYSNCAQGILDFYHAAQNLWKGAKAMFDGRTKKARDWFEKSRHNLRVGKSEKVLNEIETNSKKLEGESSKIAKNLLTYLKKHKNHIEYDKYKDSGLPIGSGMVESACKWLIQQRFKCVGMRWSEDGFNHLLHLRLLWVNGEYDVFFEQ
jgi:hypothetical protein